MIAERQCVSGMQVGHLRHKVVSGLGRAGQCCQRRVCWGERTGRFCVRKIESSRSLTFLPVVRIRPSADVTAYETGVPGGVGKLRHKDNIPSEQFE
jgi:hypothetical protein